MKKLIVTGNKNIYEKEKFWFFFKKEKFVGRKNIRIPEARVLIASKFIENNLENTQHVILSKRTNNNGELIIPKDIKFDKRKKYFIRIRKASDGYYYKSLDEFRILKNDTEYFLLQDDY